jgi:hypothetical protein
MYVYTGMMKAKWLIFGLKKEGYCSNSFCVREKGVFWGCLIDKVSCA